MSAAADPVTSGACEEALEPQRDQSAGRRL